MKYVWTQKASNENLIPKSEKIGSIVHVSGDVIQEYLEQGYIEKHPNIVEKEDFETFLDSINQSDFNTIMLHRWEKGERENIPLLKFYCGGILDIYFKDGKIESHDLESFYQIVKKVKSKIIKQIDFYTDERNYFSITLRNEKQLK